MLYIVKNNYFLTDFLLEKLLDEDSVRVLAHRRGGKHVYLGPVSKLWKTVEAYCLPRLGVRTAKTLFLDRDYLGQLTQIQPTDQVLFFGVENLKDLLIARRFIAAKRISVWLWNPLGSYRKSLRSRKFYASALKRVGMDVYTFDPQDALNMGFKEANQVYRNVDTLIELTEEAQIDVSFVGYAKNRLGELMNCHKQFSQVNLTTDFHVLAEKHGRYTPQEEAFLAREEISYAQTIQTINRSHCLLEILQNTQSGLTSRPLEALFFRKKLITNNTRIRQTSLYHPNNVFVLGVDSLDALPAFMRMPYVDLPLEVVQSYDICHWYKQFAV